MAAALLLTDAEPETRGFLERHLPRDGFELVPDHGQFDLVLAGDVERLDRWVERAPVIVLGREQADAVDRIHAFRRGCDDYVPRPFDYQELVERIRAVLRRVRPPLDDVVEAPPVRIDTRTRDVRVDGRRVQLAQKEYELLALPRTRAGAGVHEGRAPAGCLELPRRRAARARSTRTRRDCAASCARPAREGRCRERLGRGIPAARGRAGG